MIKGFGKLLHIFNRLKNTKLGKPRFSALKALVSSIARESRAAAVRLAGRIETGAIARPVFPEVEQFITEQHAEKQLKLLDEIFDIARNEDGARAVLADNLEDFFEAFVVLMRAQEVETQNRCYTAFYAVSRKILDKEFGEYSVKGGVTQRTDRFWVTLFTLSRPRKIRTFFKCDVLLIDEKTDACRQIRENERNPDVVRIKEIIWSLIHEEVNLLNYGIEKENMPANKSEVWVSEEGGRPDQPLALLSPGRHYARGRFYDRIYSLRKALKHNHRLPDINSNMKAEGIREGVNIVFFYERWSGDLIVKLKSAIGSGNANILLASAFSKNIVLREEDGVVTARLLSGMVYNKEGRLTLARFSQPLEIHYVYRVLKTPFAKNVSKLGVPVAVDYPHGKTYTRKTEVSNLLSSYQEETGVRIPGFLEFKRGALKSMRLEAFADLLDRRFPFASHEELVVKPVVGMGGKGIEFFGRQDIEGIFNYTKTLCGGQDVMIEERVKMARVSVDGQEFDSSLRFHFVKDAEGKSVVYRGLCRIGSGVVNVSLGGDARIIGMEDLFRHMTELRLSEENIEALLVRAEKSAVKVYNLLTNLDYGVVDLYFDGKDFIFNELNVGNIGGDNEFNTLYPRRRGMLTRAVCERLIFRALCYRQEVGKLRRWHRAGAYTAGTEVEIDLTTVGAAGHRRPMTYLEARRTINSFPFPDQSVYLDTSGGIETITGHRNIYDVKGETLIFARQAGSVIRYLKNMLGSNGESDNVLISCIGQYGSGVHLNIRRPSYEENPEPGSAAIKDYKRVKAVLPIISGLSANPSEGFWHPLSDDLGVRKTTEFFSVRRYGDVVYNSLNKKPFFPPRLEIRPSDTPLHPAYIGIYYAVIYAALAGKAPESLSFEEYHRAFCNGAMENLRGAVLFLGRRMSLRDALNIFYETNREIFEELELSHAQRELLDAARLNGFTYKDFNDSLGSMLNERTYLKLITEIFERGCKDPEQKLSDIIKITVEEQSDELGIQPQQAEAIYALTEFLTYRPISLISLAVPEVRQGLRLEEVRLGAGQKEAVHLLLDKGFMFKRLIPGNNGESLIVMSKRLDYSESAYFEAKRLPEPEQVISEVPGAREMRAEKPLLLVLIPEKGRPGISMRAEATYVGLVGERNQKLGGFFEFQILDLDQISSPEVIREISEKIGRVGGVIFNRFKTGKVPGEISEMLDRYGINSRRFEEAVRNKRSLLDRIRENPDLKEYVPDANSRKGVVSLKTIGGRPFVIDAVVQKDHLGRFGAVQRIVRIPKGKQEGRVHVGVTPGYAKGQQTVIEELLEDGTITEELINKMDSMLEKLGRHLEECFNSAGNFGCEILITEDKKIYIKSVTDKPFQAPVGITPIIHGRIEQAMRIADQALWRYLN